MEGMEDQRSRLGAKSKYS